MAAAVAVTAPRNCPYLFPKLLRCKNPLRIRKKMPPYLSWTQHRYYSLLLAESKKTQCKGLMHLTAASQVRQQWIPFSRTTWEMQSPHISEPGSLPETPKDPEKLAVDDLQNMFLEIHEALQVKNNSLRLICNYYFDGKGKALRPVIIVLMARALNCHIHRDSVLLSSQQKIAMIVEMIHTATLVHDDVIDSSNMRRGKPSINVIWDQRRIILAGDLIISVVAMILARLRNNDVLGAMVEILNDLVTGEFMQLRPKENEDERFTHYLAKTYKKTASLIANGCKSVAILSGADVRLQEIAFQYGRNIGIAFQLVDDLLDFVASSAVLGKPAVADLKLGLATAPVLFACQKFPELNEMIMRRFSKPGDVEKALDAVMKSDGLEQTRFLADQHCREARRCIQQIADSPERQALYDITDIVLNRMK